MKNRWTESEEKILKQLYESGKSAPEVHDAIHGTHSVDAIITRANKLGYHKRHRWTKEEEELLLSMYSFEPIEIVLDCFQWADVVAIRNKAKQYGIKSFNTINHEWKREDDDFIRNHHETMSDADIAKAIGRSFRAVKWRREKLGLFREKPIGKYEYLRKYLWKANREWRKESIRACGYKCIVTGKRFDDVHHLYSSDLILEETLAELGLEYKRVFEYSEEQLDLIATKYAELNKTHPLGVCLTNEIHAQFHNKYGYGHNTPDQFELFLKEFYPTTHILVTTTATQVTA